MTRVAITHIPVKDLQLKLQWNIHKEYNNNNSQQKKKKKQKERTSRIVDIAIPVDHWVRLKESEKKDKYQDLVRELKKI